MVVLLVGMMVAWKVKYLVVKSDDKKALQWVGQTVGKKAVLKDAMMAVKMVY